ncbi:MAG: aminoacetone oxidase family FAD-binding enzyme [Firmicutes bacterium]|nr:aminoacetone oxidase family FAD-binding enzyme [Bacillota bacterium]
MSGNIYDTAVIGAGASGLMAAIFASKGGGKTVVLEKRQEPALKLYATGNGRCNYLNAGASASSYHSGEDSGSILPAAARQIYDGCPKDLVRVFKDLGVEPAEEDGGRLYPRSFQAVSVVRALVSGAKRQGVRIACGFVAASAVKTDEGFLISSKDGRRVMASSLILACGGKAGIQYGCSGDGYAIASSFGHRIVKPIPALTGLICSENLKALAGVRAKGRISLVSFMGGASTIEGEDSGEIQFTSDGLSGICTFNVSRYFRVREGVSFIAELDLLTEYSELRLRELLLERRVKFAKEPSDMLLLGLLPAKLAVYILARAGVEDPCGTLCGALSTEAVEKLVPLCKELAFTVTGTRSWKDAQVTSGGVSLEDVDPDTLESKKVPGLFFAGEILDIDGPCGGYNLTWAFAGGRSAGSAAAKRGGAELR